MTRGAYGKRAALRDRLALTWAVLRGHAVIADCRIVVTPNAVYISPRTYAPHRLRLHSNDLVLSGHRVLFCDGAGGEISALESVAQGLMVCADEPAREL